MNSATASDSDVAKPRLAGRIRLPQSAGRQFALLLAIFFSAFGIWSWATPLFGAPDEPDHAIKAVAAVRGQWIGRSVGSHLDPEYLVRVPRFYASAQGVAGCFAHKPQVPASCAKSPSGGSQATSVKLYVGAYPPLYYSIAGLPSLATLSVPGIYLMRLVSALLSAVFLALAATCVMRWSRSRMLLAGLALGATPSVFFFGGVINPSGLEASTAICLWCSSLVLVLERWKDPPRGLVATVAVSGCAMSLCRGLSPFWLALIALTLLALAPRRAVSLVRRRDVQLMLGAILVCGALAVAWIVANHTLDVRPSVNKVPPGTSYLGILARVFGRTGPFLDQMIGEFGWLDTLSPFYVYVGWFLGLGALAAGALLFARRRGLLVLAGLSVATIVIPVLISASQARHLAFTWQGKDALPLAVGVPMLAGALLGSSAPDPVRAGRRLATGIVWLVAGIQVVAFLQALRRNSVGLLGPLNYFNGSWHPPLGLVAVTIAVVWVWLGLAWLMTWLIPRPVSAPVT